MLFSSQTSLEETILEFLLKKPMTSKVIHAGLSKEGRNVTIQAIYKALNALISQEVVLKHSTMYSLSEEWRKRAIRALERKYSPFELAEGERISLDLSSLVHLDEQWKNIVLPLHDLYPGFPSFFYNPHELWLHLSDSRTASELAYFKSFKDTKTLAFYAIGGSTLHDKEFKQQFQNEYFQISSGNRFFPDTDYPTIFGDYVIMTRISPTLAKAIENIYETSTNTIELTKNIQALEFENKKIKLIIERNHHKAKRLRKKLAADFHIPQELREKFDLF